MSRDFNHYSNSQEWIEAKAESGKWSLYKDNQKKYHLYKSFSIFGELHWFSYLIIDNLESRIKNIINDKEIHFIKVVVIKLIKKDLAPLKIEECNHSFNYKHKNIFIKKAKSACKSLNENFYIDLKKFDKKLLTKNWKRNLKRSEVKSSNFTYKNIDISKNIDKVYSIIIKNSKLKKYKYPYSKNFFKNIVLKSNSKIKGIGAFNKSNELVAIRAYYIMNNTAIDFIAAALPEAFKYYVTYNLAYKLIINAKNNNHNIYNLGGVNYKLNEGVFNFKKGLGGELKSDGDILVGIIVSKYLHKKIAKVLLSFISRFF